METNFKYEFNGNAGKMQPCSTRWAFGNQPAPLPPRTPGALQPTQRVGDTGHVLRWPRPAVSGRVSEMKDRGRGQLESERQVVIETCFFRGKVFGLNSKSTLSYFYPSCFKRSLFLPRE